MKKYFFALILIMSSRFVFAESATALWPKYFDCMKTLSYISGHVMAENKTGIEGKQALDTLVVSNVKTQDGDKKFIVSKDKIIEFKQGSLAKETKSTFELLKDQNGQYRSCEPTIGHNDLSEANVNSIKKHMESYVAGLVNGSPIQRSAAAKFIHRNSDYLTKLKECQASGSYFNVDWKDLNSLIVLLTDEANQVKSGAQTKGHGTF